MAGITSKRDMMEMCRVTIPCMSDKQVLKLAHVMLDIMNEMADEGKVNYCEGCYYDDSDRKHLPCTKCTRGDKYTTTLNIEAEANRFEFDD